MNKYIKIYSVLLITSNIVLGVLFIKYYKKSREQEMFSKEQKKEQKNYEDKLDYRKYRVYNDIFNKKNDSVYKKCFYNEYKEHPVDAYLLANTYYNLTKKDSVMKNIDLAKKQLDEIYGNNQDSTNISSQR